jgi:hypothetical protein
MLIHVQHNIPLECISLKCSVEVQSVQPRQLVQQEASSTPVVLDHRLQNSHLLSEAIAVHPQPCYVNLHWIYIQVFGFDFKNEASPIHAKPLVCVIDLSQDSHRTS